MHATCERMQTSSRYVRLHVSVFVMWTCTCPRTGDVLLHGSTLLWVATNAWGQDRDTMKGCHMCANTATDRFHRIILWAQVCKCVTCLCFSGCAPVLAKRINEMKPDGRKEQNSLVRKKKQKTWSRRKKNQRKKPDECQAKSQESAPFHTIAISIPQRRERRESGRGEKLHSNGHETIDFIEKICWKSKHNFSGSWQVWGHHCFRGCGWIHPVVFIFVWQLSHQLAINISTPCAQQLDVTTCVPGHSDNKAVKRTHVLFVFHIQLNPAVCYSTAECDQWHQPSGVTSALYVPWLICRSSGDSHVTSFSVPSDCDWWNRLTKVRIMIFDLHCECAREGD